MIEDRRDSLSLLARVPGTASGDAGIDRTIGGLAVGEATRKHRHNYETIIYVIAGSGVSLIEDRKVRWRAGDAFYVPTWAWHQHRNASATEQALYVACENAPMLQNLGIALREEA